MSADLLPCPFCGAEPVTQEIEAHTHAGGIAGFMPDYPGSFTIECPTSSCSCGMIADTHEQVVAAWNRRPALAQKEAAAPGDLHAAIMALPLLNRGEHDDSVQHISDRGARAMRKAAAELTRAALAHPVAVDALQVLVLPHECHHKKSNSHVTTAWINGWNDCRDTVRGAVPDDPTNHAAIDAQDKGRDHG